MLHIPTGVEVKIAGRGISRVKAKLICAVLDLQAKAAVLNCNQYNGAFGCSTCKHPGVMVGTDMVMNIGT